MKKRAFVRQIIVYLGILVLLLALLQGCLLRLGVGGPVGSGKTALLEALSSTLEAAQQEADAEAAA